MSGRRRFFSGTSESQAALEASAALGVPVAELLYRAVDKRGGLRPGRVVIEVDPDNPRRPAGAAITAAAPEVVTPRMPAPAAPPGRPVERAPQERRAPQGERGPAPERLLASVGPEPSTPLAGEQGAGAAAAALAALADLRVEPRVERRGDVVAVDLGGPDLDALTARRGELLRSFEYLLRRMVRELPEGGLDADAGGFRAAREEDLRRRAVGAAEEVRRSGEPVLFEPLSAAERRIVHLAVQEEAGVASASEGEGEAKRVKVFPAG